MGNSHTSKGLQIIKAGIIGASSYFLSKAFQSIPLKNFMDFILYHRFSLEFS